MGSMHRVLLGTTGGGQKLHEAEKDRYRQELDNFLRLQGVDSDGRGTAQAHFDIGYNDGYTGEEPYFGSGDWDWDE